MRSAEKRVPEGINWMEDNEFKERAKNTLTRLGLGHWHVSWLPDPSYSIRGRVVNETQSIEIYDADKEEAWNTFLHEVVELKMRGALRPYRSLVNKLIEGYQEMVDGEKDRFVESLNEVFDDAQDSPPSS